ncbi:MAG: shikimate dehydrogenase [Pseudomonadota bacterium]|nr:shikimate dehydrogenase [Pseudomonadota bacterium]
MSPCQTRMMATGAARVAGVTGFPVAHSLSPRLHGFWLAELDLDGIYAPFPVTPDAFATAVRGLAAAGVSGINVTVPHKRRAFDLSDTLDPAARAIGAVNTLLFHADGRIEGRNTDAHGFIANLVEHGVDPAAGPVLVLGAGGAARAAVHGLLAAGAPEVRIANRTRATAEALAGDLGDHRIRVVDDSVRLDMPGDLALLVNTTSLGMRGKDPLAVDLGGLGARTVVHDIVYVPLETPLLAAARARGLVAVDGLGMLLHQAVPAFEAFFGLRPQVTPALRQHLLAVL